MVFFFFSSDSATPLPACAGPSLDVDLIQLAGVFKQAAKQEADMTVAKAREQLALVMRHLHLEDGEFAIRNRHLVSRNGKMDFPVRKLIAIIPAHGTVMAVMPREVCDELHK